MPSDDPSSTTTTSVTSGSRKAERTAAPIVAEAFIAAMITQTAFSPEATKSHLCRPPKRDASSSIDECRPGAGGSKRQHQTPECGGFLSSQKKRIV
ncbi:hypothetical protein GCM10007937_32130 [Mesorhizobium albiziae]|nr:hypothetical protein GCM10007937_32130 [Mesorhizobium albiziae]